MLICECKATDERSDCNSESRVGLGAVNHQRVDYQRDE